MESKFEIREAGISRLPRIPMARALRARYLSLPFSKDVLLQEMLGSELSYRENGLAWFTKVNDEQGRDEMDATLWRPNRPACRRNSASD